MNNNKDPIEIVVKNNDEGKYILKTKDIQWVTKYADYDICGIGSRWNKSTRQCKNIEFSFNKNDKKNLIQYAKCIKVGLEYDVPPQLYDYIYNVDIMKISTIPRNPMYCEEFSKNIYDALNNYYFDGK
jgi:hypothetical protein